MVKVLRRLCWSSHWLSLSIGYTDLCADGLLLIKKIDKLWRIGFAHFSKSFSFLPWRWKQLPYSSLYFDKKVSGQLAYPNWLIRLHHFLQKSCTHQLSQLAKSAMVLPHLRLKAWRRCLPQAQQAPLEACFSQHYDQWKLLWNLLTLLA